MDLLHETTVFFLIICFCLIGSFADFMTQVYNTMGPICSAGYVWGVAF